MSQLTQTASMWHEPCQARLAAQQHALNSVEGGDGMYLIMDRSIWQYMIWIWIYDDPIWVFHNGSRWIYHNLTVFDRLDYVKLMKRIWWFDSTRHRPWVHDIHERSKNWMDVFHACRRPALLLSRWGGWREVGGRIHSIAIWLLCPITVIQAHLAP